MQYYDNKGIIHEIEVKTDKNGFFYRENTSDKAMIKDCLKEYDTIDFDGKVVFDCGANVGALTKIATMRGAKQVIAYEPEETNYQMALLNNRYNENVIIKNTAVSGLDDDTLSFWINKSNNAQCSGALECTQKGRRVEVIVNNLNFWKELDKYKPDIIKMDIEGGEYSIFEDGFTIPDYVKDIAIEIHQPKRMNKLFKDLNKIFPVVKHKHVIIMFKSPGMIVTHLSK